MWTISSDGKYYLDGRLIRNVAAYGASMRRGFIRRERERDDRRPVHFSLDAPIDPRYNKPVAPDRGGDVRANLWGMPIANDEPIRPFEFYRTRMIRFIEYAQRYVRISKREAEWLLNMLMAIYYSVKENRADGKYAIHVALERASKIAKERGRLAKFVGLLHDIAATPGWFAISREEATIAEALAIDHAARHLWEHPRDRDIRRGLRSFTPKRAHRRRKK